MKFKKQLQEINACREATRWVDDKSLKEAWSTCERGDWMLWYYFRANGFDKHLVRAKADCASLVSHLMTNERSIDALQACYDYVDGKISMEELRIASDAAYRAACDSDADYAASYAASDVSAAYAAAAGAAAAAYDSDADYAATADSADSVANARASANAAASAANAAYANAAFARSAARKETLKKCANICREVLTKSLFTEKLTNTKT